MRAIVLPEPWKAVTAEREIPVPKQGEALLKMVCGGICGSDLASYRGQSAYVSYPRTIGHEFAAEVVEVGENPYGIKKGMLVTGNPYFNCGTCYSCRHGHENACENFNCLGVQSDGLGAEYFVIDSEYVYPIPESCPLDEAVLIEPFAVGIHAALRGQVQGKRVLVVGAGTIGNFTAQACQLLGASEVAVCDLSDDKIEMAKRAGIQHCVSSAGRSLKDVAYEIYGTFPDVILDCVGAKVILPQILELAGKTTTVVIVGNYSEPVLIDVATIQRNELNVLGNITYTAEDFQKAVELMVSGKVYTEGFISAKFPFDEVQGMMEFALEKRGVNMKVVLEYNGEG